MKNTKQTSLAAAVCMLFWAVRVFAQPQVALDALAGDWVGRLEPAPGRGFTIVFRFEAGADRAVVGSAHTPERSERGLPIESIEVVDRNLTLALPGGGQYAATIDGDTMRGTWSINGQSSPLAMTRGSYTSPTAVSGDVARVAGVWSGRLQTGAVSLRLVLRTLASELGTVTAVLDSPDQGAVGMPLDALRIDGNSVRFALNRLSASYEGTLDAAGATIAGTFTQSGAQLPLSFAKGESVAANRPQMPQRPFPYREEEVTYRNERAGIAFAGTLTLPVSGAPFPAAILLTGSGPQDRDETIAGHKPFLVLADYLTRRGIAVLRSDDRGVGGSQAGSADDTSADFATDALAAAEYLQGRADIDDERIGLIGHSEGGLVAAIAAAESADLAFVVMLAGTGTTGDEVLHAQTEFMLRQSGASDAVIAALRSVRTQIFEIVKADSTVPLADRFGAVRADLVAELRDGGFPEQTAVAQVDALIRSFANEWFRYFLRFDPANTLRQVRAPVLALGGERDFQVPARDNLPAIEAALRAGGNADYTVRELPELNHLFQTSRTGAASEYAEIEETFDPDALALVGDWVFTRVGQPPQR